MKNPTFFVIFLGAALTLLGLLGALTRQRDIDGYSKASRRHSDITGMPPIHDASDFGAFVHRLGVCLLIVGLLLVGLGVWSLLKQ